MLLSPSLVSCLLISGVAAAPKPSKASHNHAHTLAAPRALPGSWHQPKDHPVHALFRRGNDGLTYPDVGTPAWAAAYPSNTPDSKSLPASWVNALNVAMAAGKIPDIPLSTQSNPEADPTYPTGNDPNNQTVCSATYQCKIPGDIWDSPDGIFASSFDDGPLPPTTALVDFLTENNVTTTHFMIGTNILQNPNEFLKAFNAGHDIAVHTWTHPYMTTLSNLDVLGQLGWTMQIIHNSTGGRVPRYWRPPYGDSDTRTGAIAREVFGLQTVIWNNDTNDWAATSNDQVEKALTQFLASPKSPGLIILEHELSNLTVNSFMDAYPQIAAAGWKFESLAKAINDGRTYQNAQDSQSNDVKIADILIGPNSSTASVALSSSTIVSHTTATAVGPGTSGHTLSPDRKGQKGASIASHDMVFISKSYLSLIVGGVLTGVFGILL